MIEAENALKMTRKALFNLLNSPVLKDTKIAGELNNEQESTDISLEFSFDTAMKNRPEVKIVSLQEKMLNSIVCLAKAQNKPNIAFVGNYDYKRPFYFDDVWGDSWNLSVNLSLPLFDGFSSSGKIKQAKTKLDQIILVKNQLEKGIKLEIEKYCLDIEKTKKKILATLEYIN